MTFSVYHFQLEKYFCADRKNCGKRRTCLSYKNGYGKMVVLSLEAYTKIVDKTEIFLDEVDIQAASSDKRMSYNEVFDGLRKNPYKGKDIDNELN